MQNMVNSGKRKLFTQRPLLWVTLGLVFAVVAILYFSNDNSEKAGRLIPAELQAVTKISVENPSGGYTIERIADAFELAGVDPAIVDGDKLQTFLDGLLSLTRDNAVPGKQIRPAEISARVELSYVRGQTSKNKKRQQQRICAFVVGEEAPAQLGNYIGVAGHAGVYLCPKHVSEMLFFSRLDFVSNSLFGAGFAADDFDEVVLSSVNTGQVRISKGPGEHSFLVTSDDYCGLLVDKYRDLFVGLLSKTGTVQAVAPTVTEQDAYGVFTPDVQIKITKKEHTEAVKLSSAIDGVCFVLTSAGDRVLEVPESEFWFLRGDSRGLCRSCFVENPLEVKSISIKKRGRERIIECNNQIGRTSDHALESPEGKLL
ncbi:MAG: hypothetical protein LBJ38_00335, partial [Oscillospiraceae bacterium]|nr:hypothetical protein [Oscillospiraceae bacterium]